MKKQIKVLLVEDNPDDVELIRILSADISTVFLDITPAGYLSEGIKLLSEKTFDIILLDLFLPDSTGIDTLSKFHTITAETPVIVMTGHNDEEFAAKAVQQGAQDYLIKGQVDPNLLWRSVKYAIERKKMQAQLEELRLREQRDKEINSLKQISGHPSTEVTARFLGITSLKKYAPDAYRDIAEHYGKLLDYAIEKRIYRVEYSISDGLRSLSAQMGFLKAGPRDVIEIHTAVLEEKCRRAAQPKAQAYIEEGRIMLLELMGDIVMFYRNYYVENRNPFPQQKNKIDASKKIQEVKNDGK